MGNFDEFFPFDPGFGATANSTRWRKMGKLWAPDGVVRGYLNNLNATQAGSQVTVQTGAVFIHGLYGEIVNNQTFTVGTNGTIVAQVSLPTNDEFVQITYRDGVMDYGSNPATAYRQDPEPGANIWEIPLWLISSGTLVDLRTFIQPGAGVAWWNQQSGTSPVYANSTAQVNLVTARVPYAGMAYIRGTMLLTFTDLSQAQSVICQLTYQQGASDQQLSPVTTPLVSGGAPANQPVAISVALDGLIPVTQGKKTLGWRVTAGTGPFVQIAALTLGMTLVSQGAAA